MNKPKILILGGGFGGLRTARYLKNADVDITLVDRTNHHLFQPLLYQVASSALAPRDIAYPIREILKTQPNTTVIMDEATAILPNEKSVLFRSGRKINYDTLVVAVGTRHSYFGHPEWEQYAPGLKTLEDGITIRNTILNAFEQAEASQNPKEIEELLTFAVIGGGPTGVELAGAIAEIAQKTMLQNFRNIDPSQTKVYLIEAGKYILPFYPEYLSERAKKDLTNLGVDVLTDSPVTNLTESSVEMGERTIRTSSIFWAAGNQAPELLQSIGCELDRQNRVIVEENLTVPNQPDIFVIGDAAHVKDRKGGVLPGVAPVAIQQGEYIGRIIEGGKLGPFQYHDKGSMATIGKAHAVALINGRQFTGFTAWVLWSLVHIAFLIGFRNRLIVMLEWFFWYVTGNRSSRLIHRAPRTFNEQNS